MFFCKKFISLWCLQYWVFYVYILLTSVHIITHYLLFHSNIMFIVFQWRICFLFLLKLMYYSFNYENLVVTILIDNKTYNFTSSCSSFLFVNTFKYFILLSLTTFIKIHGRFIPSPFTGRKHYNINAVYLFKDISCCLFPSVSLQSFCFSAFW